MKNTIRLISLIISLFIVLHIVDLLSKVGNPAFEYSYSNFAVDLALLLFLLLVTVKELIRYEIV